MVGQTAPSPGWLRLGPARGCCLLGAATLALWLLMGADKHLRSGTQEQAAADRMAHLHLTAPAYFPAGHPLRHPESRVRGIPSTHAPGLQHNPARGSYLWLPMVAPVREGLP